MGKSAIIAQKMVSTLNSFGIFSVFLHPVESLHGDKGIIKPNDCLIFLSKSGNSPEIKVFFETFHDLKNNLIAIVGDTSSYLAQKANVVINCYVSKEACIYNIAPTSSTTLQLIICDALAISLIDLKEISKQDFIKNHPGGHIGKSLTITVEKLLLKNAKPHVKTTDSVHHVILNISKNRLGATVVMNSKQKIVGIITDGDLRRMLESQTHINDLKALDICTKQFSSVQYDAYLNDVILIMKQKQINQMIVLKKQAYLGILHIQDFLNDTDI